MASFDDDRPMTPEPPARTHPPRLEDFPAAGPNALATITQRGVARAIDTALQLLPAMFLVLPFVTVEGDKVSTDVPIWVGAVALAIAVLYEVSLVAWKGQTLGKWALGVRVARFADGKRPSWSQSSLRSLLPASFVALPVPILNAGWVVVFMSALYSPLRRGWHDHAGGTIVVRTR